MRNEENIFNSYPYKGFSNDYWIVQKNLFYQNPFTYMKKLQEKFGNCAVLYKGNSILLSIKDSQGSLLVIEPEYIQKILTNPDLFPTASNREIPHALTQNLKILSSNVASTSDSSHRSIRSLLLKEFSTKRIKEFDGKIKNCINESLSILEPELEVNLTNFMRNLSFRLVDEVILGVNGSDTFSLSHLIFDLLEKRRAFDFKPYSKDELINCSDKLVNLLREKIKFFRTNIFIANRSIFGRLCLFKNNGDYQLTEEDLIGNVNLLCLSSVESLNSAIIWTLFFIAVYPKYQIELKSELEKFKNLNFFELLDTKKYPMLDKIIKESLRILPPPALIVRIAREETQFGQFLIPADTEIVISPFMTHRLPQIYHYPEKFSPERWDKINPTQFEYFPFLAGPKSCLGIHLALTEIRAIVAMTLNQFALRLPNNSEINWNMHLTLHSKELPMIFSKNTMSNNFPDITGSINDIVSF